MFRTLCLFGVLLSLLHCAVSQGCMLLLSPDWTCFWDSQGRGLILDLLLPLMCSLLFVSSAVVIMVSLGVWSADPLLGWAFLDVISLFRATSNLYKFTSSSLLPSPSHHVYASSILTADFWGVGFYLPFKYRRLNTLEDWTCRHHVTNRKSWSGVLHIHFKHLALTYWRNCWSSL